MSNIYRILEYWFGGYTLDDYSERWEASGLQPALYFPPYYNIKQGGVYPLREELVSLTRLGIWTTDNIKVRDLIDTTK